MTSLPSIQQATRQYEAWLAGQLRIVQSDLSVKHELMAEDAFSFLRATFYRWAQIFPALCPDLAAGPTVLAIGDLHVENYGTWRDAEGRLVWGINDFDEAFPLPYPLDLVRLATSAWLAIEVRHLAFDPVNACSAILKGYLKALENGGEPYVLAEKHPWLRAAVTSRLRDHTRYWEKFTALPTVKKTSPEVKLMLQQVMPEKGLDFRIAHRRAGLGSLGRERFTALAHWRGSLLAREAKALLPSACTWASGATDAQIYYPQILGGSVRAPDPFLMMHGTWVVRRLSPYCSRIELSQLPREHDIEKLLRAMGRELANVHLGTPRAVPAVLRDLARRKTKWLRQAAEVMVKSTRADWQAWRRQED